MDRYQVLRFIGLHPFRYYLRAYLKCKIRGPEPSAFPFVEMSRLQWERTNARAGPDLQQVFEHANCAFPAGSCLAGSLQLGHTSRGVRTCESPPKRCLYATQSREVSIWVYTSWYRKQELAYARRISRDGPGEQENGQQAQKEATSKQAHGCSREMY